MCSKEKGRKENDDVSDIIVVLNRFILHYYSVVCKGNENQLGWKRVGIPNI